MYRFVRDVEEKRFRVLLLPGNPARSRQNVGEVAVLVSCLPFTLNSG